MPSFYIALEKKLENVDTDVNGGSLSKYNKKIEMIAKSAGVAPLLNFFSPSAEELSAFAEDHGVQLNEAKVPDEKWPTGEEGLRTVDALLANPENLPAERVAQELHEFRRVLELAKAKGIRWHLAVYY